MISAKDIKAEVEGILRRAAGSELTSYDILDKLADRDRIIRQRGRCGAYSGKRYTSASLVASTLQLLYRERKVSKRYTNGGKFSVAGRPVDPGYSEYGSYKIL